MCFLNEAGPIGRVGCVKTISAYERVVRGYILPYKSKTKERSVNRVRSKDAQTQVFQDPGQFPVSRMLLWQALKSNSPFYVADLAMLSRNSVPFHSRGMEILHWAGFGPRTWFSTHPFTPRFFGKSGEEDQDQWYVSALGCLSHFNDSGAVTQRPCGSWVPEQYQWQDQLRYPSMHPSLSCRFGLNKSCDLFILLNFVCLICPTFPKQELKVDCALHMSVRLPFSVFQIIHAELHLKSANHLASFNSCLNYC